ncbi:hypothetical protein ILUMI_13636, partial [Ignelater luminosus]
MMFHFLNHSKNLEEQTTTYLVAGRTYKPVDSVYAVIENYSKNINVQVPSELPTIIRNARRCPKPYETIQIYYPHILDWKSFSAPRKLQYIDSLEIKMNEVTGFQPVNKSTYSQPMEVDTNRTKNSKPFQQNFNQRLHYVSKEKQENRDENKFKEHVYEDTKEYGIEELNPEQFDEEESSVISKKLPGISQSEKLQTWYTLDFHPKYYRLIGMDLLQGATAIIDIPKRKLITKNTTIAFEVSNPYRTGIPPGELKIVRIRVSKEEGTAMPFGQEITEEVYFQSLLITCYKNEAYTLNQLTEPKTSRHHYMQR